MSDYFNPDAFDNLPSLRGVIDAHGLKADKSLGQNFLLDQNITDKIARLAVQMNHGFAGHTVIEIGPGPGGLTRSLLRTDADKIIAIEFDPRAVGVITELKAHAPDRLDIVQADALKADIASIAPAPRAIVANLPYNISTVLLVQWLSFLRSNPQWCSGMTLMFQKEVADRIVAEPDGRAYGRLSVIAQWLCDVRRLYELPPSAFTPPPKISSTVLGFVPRNFATPQPAFKTVERVLAAAFNQRRKMIRSSLKEFWPAVEAVGLEETARAENIPPGDYIRLALQVEDMTAV